MEVCGIKFEEKQIDGKWCLQPTEKITDVAKFQELMKLFKSKGGLYSRANGFIFESKPEFGEDTPPKKVEAPAPKVVPAEVVQEKKEIKELDKPENKIKEEDIPKGTEIEVYKPLTLEECCTFFKGILAKPEYQAPDHQTLIKYIFIKCKDDEELRANISHKNYDDMLTNGAKAWAQRNKKSGNVCCTPQDILEDVIAEYKKPIVKKTVKKDTSTKPATKSKKKTTKKK